MDVAVVSDVRWKSVGWGNTYSHLRGGEIIISGASFREYIGSIKNLGTDNLENIKSLVLVFIFIHFYSPYHGTEGGDRLVLLPLMAR